jgi:hypothetical protein
MASSQAACCFRYPTPVELEFFEELILPGKGGWRHANSKAAAVLSVMSRGTRPRVGRDVKGQGDLLEIISTLLRARRPNAIGRIVIIRPGRSGVSALRTPAAITCDQVSACRYSLMQWWQK